MTWEKTENAAEQGMFRLSVLNIISYNSYNFM